MLFHLSYFTSNADIFFLNENILEDTDHVQAKPISVTD